MKVKEIASGKILEVNACYATRLIEQGRAVLPEKEAMEPAKKGSKKTVADDGAD